MAPTVERARRRIGSYLLGLEAPAPAEDGVEDGPQPRVDQQLAEGEAPRRWPLAAAGARGCESTAGTPSFDSQDWWPADRVLLW